MNYPAFKELLQDKCFVGEVFFIPSLRYVNSSKSDQYMIRCHGHPPVIESYITFNIYDYDFTLYPVNKTSIMIFEYCKSSEPFCLSQLYNIEWTNTVPVPEELLSLPLPMSITNTETLYSMLANAKPSTGRCVLILCYNYILNFHKDNVQRSVLLIFVVCSSLRSEQPSNRSLLTYLCTSVLQRLLNETNSSSLMCGNILKVAHQISHLIFWNKIKRFRVCFNFI